MIYATATDGNIYALNSTNGAIVWKFFTGARVVSSVAISSNGLVYSGSTNGQVYALSSLDGSVIWKRYIGSITASPTLANGYLYAVNSTGTIFAFSPFTLSNQFFSLNVKVMNSTGISLPGASVKIAGASRQTDSQGNAAFRLPTGSYNVTASLSGYSPSSWIVDLSSNRTIALTLARNYHFLGEIPDSDITIQGTSHGFNVALINLFSSSPSDIFFDWNYMGTIAAGGSRSFNFYQMPDLVVMAAALGSADSPNAWYKHPLPIALPPTNGRQGAFLSEPVPYAAGSIFVIPYPPVQGQQTTIGVILHDPQSTKLDISRVDFQLSGLTIGGPFASIGSVSGATLAGGETSTFVISWIATVSGHHCVRVVLTYSDGSSQALQRNIDIEDDIPLGGAGAITFQLGNPTESTQIMTLNIEQQLPPGWSDQLEVDGRFYGTSVQPTFALPAGASVTVTLSVFSDPNNPGNGTIDIQGYISSRLIGGIHKIVRTLPPSYNTCSPSNTDFNISPFSFQKDINISGTILTPSISVDTLKGSAGACIDVSGFSLQSFRFNLGVTTGITLKLTASKGFAYDNTDKPFALSAPIPLGDVLVGPINIALTVTPLLVVTARLNSSITIGVMQDSQLSLSLLYSQQNGWNSIKSFTCTNDPSLSKVLCLQPFGSITVNGTVVLQPELKYSLLFFGLGGIDLTPYVSARTDFSLATPSNEAPSCNGYQYGQTTGIWAAACGELGIQLGGTLAPLGYKIASYNTTLVLGQALLGATVQILPNKPSIQQGQQQEFTAIVAGTNGYPVVWSIQSGSQSCSNSDLSSTFGITTKFTAPNKPGQCILTATAPGLSLPNSSQTTIYIVTKSATPIFPIPSLIVLTVALSKAFHGMRRRLIFKRSPR